MIVTTRSLLLRIRHIKIHLCASEANKNAFESLSTLISQQHLFVAQPIIKISFENPLNLQLL